MPLQQHNDDNDDNDDNNDNNDDDDEMRNLNPKDYTIIEVK